MMYLPTIEQVVGGYNIRYDKLMELIPSYFAGSSATEINLYIDITPMIKQCCCDCNVADSKDKDIILVSSIINMCAHYRQFFKSRLGVYAHIYIVLSSMATPYNKKHVKKYNNAPKEIGSFNIALVNKTVDYLKLLTKYIEGVYFVQTEHEAAVAMYGLIHTEDIRHCCYPNIVLTKDIYDYQLVAAGAAILRPKKSTSGDTSYIFGCNEVIDVYLMERKVMPEQVLFGHELLPVVMALTRLPERGLKSLKAIPTVVKHLNDLISDGLITNTSDVGYICNLLERKKVKINTFEITCRFNAIDIISQYFNLSAGGFLLCQWDSVNLYDPDSLKALNNKEFKDHPLDLMAF